MHRYIPVSLWRSENNFWKSVLSLHQVWSSGCRLGGTSLSLLSPLASLFSIMLYLLAFPADVAQKLNKKQLKGVWDLFLAHSVRVQSTCGLGLWWQGYDAS